MLKEEIMKIIRRKQFVLVFTIFLCAVFLDFLITCKCYYGIELSWVRSAYKCNILDNSVGAFTAQFFTTLFPIMVCIGTADVYYEENTLGMNNFILTRVKKRKNIKFKVISLLVVTFAMIFIPLIINYGLTLTAFPLQGHYCSNATYLTLTYPEKDRLLGYLEMFYPYLNIFVFIIIRCMVGCALSFFSFSFSVVCPMNRYVVLFSGMIYYVLFNCITGLPRICDSVINISLFQINSYGSIWAIIGFIVFTFFVGGVMIHIGLKKEMY